MRHRTTPRFWEHDQNLPAAVRDLADTNFPLLPSASRHPSWQFKKVGNLRSVRVGLVHRALAVEDGEDFLWVWMGTHDDDDRLIRGRYPL
jgi:hypothetical protein